MKTLTLPTRICPLCCGVGQSLASDDGGMPCYLCEGSGIEITETAREYEAWLAESVVDDSVECPF
jgi:hypothetical protein